jgi:hypothetical protein
LDEVFERVLVDDQGQSYVFSARKPEILWKLDRKTGKYLGHKEIVFQMSTIPTARPRANHTYATTTWNSASANECRVAPSTEGGKTGPQCLTTSLAIG